MKKAERILSNIRSNKELLGRIEKQVAYFPEQFVHDAEVYLKAIKEARMCCVIHSVAPSGMSRVMSFHSCEKSHQKESYWYRQYTCLFRALGYTQTQDKNGFRISGCGMDMVFATNYDIIHRLQRLGFINEKECEILAQRTPVYF